MTMRMRKGDRNIYDYDEKYTRAQNLSCMTLIEKIAFDQK